MLQEDIFISEIQKLQGEVTDLNTLLVKKDERLALFESETSWLYEVIKKLKREAFGPRKERWESEEQMIFNEVEVEAKNPKPEDLADDESDVEVGPFKRARGKRKPLPEHLPRAIVPVELPPEEQFAEDGTPLKPIGKVVSEKLVYEPAKMSVIEYHRIRYGVDSGDPVKTAPPVPSIIPKGIATPSLLAGITTNKYGYGLPLYRQEEMFKHQGIVLPRCTQARWVIKCAEASMPILNCLEEKLLAEPYTSCDETRVQVLKEEGRAAESQSWMWVRCTPAAKGKIVLFDYDPHRSGEVAKRLFADYKGILQVDGYSAYNILEKQEGITRIGCNMHGRRYFFDASDGASKGKPLANAALKFYQKIYKIEELAKGLSWDERHDLRHKEAKPIWEEFKHWADENQRKVPPKSKIGQAFHYFQGEYSYLIGYLQNGMLEADNGFAERGVKNFAIGRKAWLFSDSVDGAQASSLFYSFYVTAKLNGVNPYFAHTKIFELLPYAKTIDDFDRLADILLARPPPS